MRRILSEIDDHIERNGLVSEVFDAEPIPTISVGPTVENIDLRAAGIRTVIWATGHRRTYPWLQIPVLDADGELRQRRGVTPVPGSTCSGQRFQHFRSSNFIGRVGRGAAYVADHIVAHRASISPRTDGPHAHRSTSPRRRRVGAPVSGAMNVDRVAFAVVEAEDIVRFTAMTGDRNPLHYGADVAAASRFGGIIVQGGVTTGLLNALVAEDLPGPGSVFLNVNWDFRAPTRPGDVITAHAEIISVHAPSRSARCAPRSPISTATRSSRGPPSCTANR